MNGYIMQAVRGCLQPVFPSGRLEVGDCHEQRD